MLTSINIPFGEGDESTSSGGPGSTTGPVGEGVTRPVGEGVGGSMGGAAVVGGVCENLSMLTGISALALVAAGFYVLAFVLSLRRSS